MMNSIQERAQVYDEINKLKEGITKLVYGSSESEGQLPALDVEAISERSRKIDCDHLHARRCWILLDRALNNSFQALSYTKEARVEKAFESWRAFRDKHLDPEWLRAEGILEDAISESVQDGETLEVDDSTGAFDGAWGQGFAIAFKDAITKGAGERGISGGTASDDSLLKDFYAHALDRMYESAERQGLDLKQALRFTGYSGELTAHGQKRMTLELVQAIDVALAVDDYQVFNEAMRALADVNPSAHAALKCLKGVKGTLADMSSQWAPSTPSPPQASSVFSLMQGAKPDEDVRGFLTGMLYFEKRSAMEEISIGFAGGIAILGLLLTATDFFLDRWEEHEKKEEAQTQQDLHGLQESMKDEEKKHRASSAHGILKELQQLRGDVLEDRDNLSSGHISTKKAKRRLQQSQRKFQALKRGGEETAPGGAPAGEEKGGETASETGRTPHLGPTRSSVPASGPVRQPKGGGQTPPRFPQLEDIEKRILKGTGAGEGELPPPGDRDVGSEDEDTLFGLVRKLRLLQMQHPEPLTLDNHPDFEWLSTQIVLQALERQADEIEKYILEHRITEEAFYEMMADEHGILPLDYGLFPEIPGRVTALQDCFVIDPVAPSEEDAV